MNKEDAVNAINKAEEIQEKEALDLHLTRSKPLFKMRNELPEYA